jgi:hypothetical protein
MSQGRTTPIWPLAVVILFAFAMSVTAPRAWERVAQRCALKPAVPLAARPSKDVVARAPASSVVKPIELPSPVQSALPQNRVAAEYVAEPVAPTLELPKAPAETAAPAVVASIATAPTVAFDPLDELPTLDRPRLSCGLLRTKPPESPVVVPTPTQVAVVPERQPSPIALPETPREESLPAEPAVPEPVVPPKPSWWPEPADLLARLKSLDGHPATHGWAERTIGTLEQLGKTDGLSTPEVAVLLGQLRRATADSLMIDERRLDEATAVELRLARHALVRRLDVWEALSDAARHEAAAVESPAVAGARQLEQCLTELAVQTEAAGDVGRQWRDYLLLDALTAATRNAGENVDRTKLVHDVLARMQRAGENTEHREFLHRGPFAQLHDSLRLLVEEELDPQQLLNELERFEQGCLPSDGRELAGLCAALAESPDETKRKLGERLQLHYRNANVRITFSPDILNRLLPDNLKRQTPVDDTILGKETRGWSTSRTGLKVHFVPSNDRLTVQLTAEGIVNAHTRTFSGPVRLFSSSNSAFHAEKEIELTTAGVSVKPAVATSRNNTRLKAIESDFDGVPILGGLVAAIAHNQHDDKKSAAQREAAWKTANYVEKSLDDDLNRHLQQADAKLNERILRPLADLRVEAEIVDLHSTEARAAIRFRTAGEDQLAANTPRPRAYADNLASLQIHQSAVNNVVDRLGLQGRRFTLPELYALIVERLRLPGGADLSKLPTDLELTFAATDPLTIRCENGRLELRMALDELRVAERSWRNFTIRAPFRADVIEGAMCFLRDGVVRISGERLGTTSQISLRTVFAKVFPEDMKVRLWPERLVDDPRFADLDIEKVDLRDGWIGIAVGPRHGAPAPNPAAPAAPTNAILPWLLRK